MNFIDRKLNNTTMYRVLIYSLIVLSLWSILGSVIGRINFSILALIASLITLLFSSILAHQFFKKIFKAPANIESTIITALILFLILEPSLQPNALLGLALAGLIAVAVKYIFIANKAHIFNPVALTAVIVGIPLIAPAIWWVGGRFMFIPVLITGLLIIKKIRRFDLFFTTVATSIITIIFYGLLKDLPLNILLDQHFFSWPIIFFATYMVTEPLSTPPQKWQRIVYGSFIGIFSSIPIHIAPIYSTPELILIIANLFSFTLGLRGRLILKLIKKEEIANEIYEFTFKLPHKIKYLPGQYLEWALPHQNPDDRGIKRYLTISSSPTEDDLAMAVKIPPNPSSFKKILNELEVNDTIFASQLIGDFTLPKNISSELVFIAGGIGITPFRSMIKYHLDKNIKLPATLFYCVNHESEFAYQDLFKQAEKIGLKVIYIITDTGNTSWTGEKGFIDNDMLIKYINDLQACRYYISGPPSMVNAYKSLLRKNKIPNRNIKTDFFPGYV